MGRIEKGFNGGFKGKVGKIVGSSWRELDYIRSVPKRSSVPATTKQLIQQAKFALAVRFLQPFKEILNIGYQNQNSGRSTGYNMALRETLYTAVSGEFPNLSLDYSKIIISKGGLAKPEGLQFVSNQPEELIFTWLPRSNDLNARASDKAIILMFNAGKETYSESFAEVTRMDGECMVSMPAIYSGDVMHAYFFFVSEKGDRCSESVYAGQATVA